MCGSIRNDVSPSKMSRRFHSSLSQPQGDDQTQKGRLRKTHRFSAYNRWFMENGNE
jgi:hypothetical protein